MTKLGLVKNYLKFKLDNLFGVIGCEKSNISYLPNKNGNIGSLCMVGFAEQVIIWNMKTNEIVETIFGESGDKVTYLSYFNSDVSGLILTIGYESGYVSVYSSWAFEKLFSLKCHKHAISYIIHCKPYGERIICGSKDNSITVIDIFEEKGFELKGHVSPITKLHYIHEKDVLISSSQDGNIKFWTLEEKHCFKTLSNMAKVWDFYYCDILKLLVTGSCDPFIRAWKLEFCNANIKSNKSDSIEGSLADAYSNLIQATYLGELQRNSNKRVVELNVDQTGGYMVLNTAEKTLEVYKILNQAELKKRLKKKMKKASTIGNGDPKSVTLTLKDRLESVAILDMPSSCKAIDVIYNFSGDFQRLEILSSMHNNTLAVMHFTLPRGKDLSIKEHITQPGHRTAVIYAQFTSDNFGILTVSLSEAKLWEKSSLKCLFTFGWSKAELANNGNADEYKKLCAAINIVPGQNMHSSTALLLPGDRHVIIGFKNGSMLVYHLIDGSIIQSVKSHTESISSLILNAEKNTVISTSVDKSLLLWKLEYSSSASLNGNKIKSQLQLVLQEPAQSFSNGISCAGVTSDGKLFVIAFYDNKVRTYLSTDTTRRILDLYGHSEPVTCLSIKYDNSQILTGSSDKSVRSWNLPYGDCKIFRGHTDPITDVKYVPGRSMAFSADKSGLIIQIDLKNMTEIYRLVGHGNQVCSLAIEATGTEQQEEDGVELENAEVVSVSTDGSIRLWYESEEILNKEMEQMDESDRKFEKEEMVRDEIIIVGAPRNAETNVLTKKTINTERCADELAEAIDSYEKLKMDPRSVPDQKMTAMGFRDPELYILEILRRIKSGDLEFALGQLPLPYVSILVEVLAEFIKKNRETLLACRCLLFLGKLHFKFFTTYSSVVQQIDKISELAPVAINNYTNLIGFNAEAFQYFKNTLGPELQKFTEKRKIAKSGKSKKK